MAYAVAWPSHSGARAVRGGEGSRADWSAASVK